MTDRIKCCVPFCRRTAPREKHPTAEEIICGKCWRRIPAAVRARRATLKRRSKRVGRLYERVAIKRKPGLIEQAGRLERQFDALWDRNWQELKRGAIGGGLLS